MPTIHLNDALGLNLDGSLAGDAQLTAILPAFGKLQNLKLEDVPAGALSAGLQFNRPVGAAGVTVGAGASARVSLIGAGEHVLDVNDPFGAIGVRDGEIYAAVALDCTADASAFGFTAGAEFTLTCYRRFGKDAAFGPALAATLAAIALPRTEADLGDVADGVVLVLAGTGRLSLTGDFQFAMPVQTLASVAIAGGVGVQVNTGASISVSAGIELSGGYQVRVRRTPAHTVEMGVYRGRSRDATLSVTAAAGVSAQAGGFDLAEQFIGALSRQPVVDVDEFRRAQPGDVEAFRTALKAAVQTKVEVSVSAALSVLRADDAAWTFEIDPGKAVTAEAQGMVGAALAGDFGPLTAARTLPAGIVQTSNVLTKVDVSKLTWRVNLLGIANLLSVAKLTEMTTVQRNAAGDITLVTDTASANRLEAVLVNLGLDSKRLRKMLNENFLIEAAYHASGAGLLPPEFQSRQTFFEIQGDTGRDEMKDNLDVARVLGLISPAEETRRMGDRKSFGRTTFYASAGYTNAAVRRMFLDGAGNPRTIEEYEQLGRSALGALLAGDPGQEGRLRYTDLGMEGSALWARMKQTGNVALFASMGLPPAAGPDYIAITDWAKAMHATGAAMGDRERLKERLADVVSSTHEHFGDPLGMIMAYLAADQDATVSVLATGDQIERLEIGTTAQAGSAHA
jgi:hypothetical protein